MNAQRSFEPKYIGTLNHLKPMRAEIEAVQAWYDHVRIVRDKRLHDTMNHQELRGRNGTIPV